MKIKKRKRGRPLDIRNLKLARKYADKGLVISEISKKLKKHPKQIYRWLDYDMRKVIHRR